MHQTRITTKMQWAGEMQENAREMHIMSQCKFGKGTESFQKPYCKKQAHNGRCKPQLYQMGHIKHI